ncbi:phosphatase [Alphaproteobacteria bacterium]|nr:phosphatase [Alphaproteobacteria bacterium]
MAISVGPKSAQQRWEEHVRVIVNLFDEYKEAINRLNVFPVPDGDTGTNMSLTLQKVLADIAKLDPNASLQDVARAFQTSSLIGARGNSGVMLSQWLRGLWQPVIDHKKPKLTKGLIAEMLESANQTIRSSKKDLDLVEGTIATVAKDLFVAIQPLADDKKLKLSDLVALLAKESLESVARTPDQMEVLRENGVVDAGACGLAVIVVGLARALGADVQIPPELLLADKKRPAIEQLNDWEDSRYTYCTEFLFHGNHLDVDSTLRLLSSLGDCEMLVGGAPLWKVHVHTNQPNEALALFLKHGEISDVFIHNMRIEVSENAPVNPGIQTEPAEVGFVVVTSGDGIKEILYSLGHTVEIVDGGQTNNPSVGDIVAATEHINARQVIVLPNNKNVIMAAEEAAKLVDKETAVVKTRSVVQAISLLGDIRTDLEFADAKYAMEKRLVYIKFGAITTAVKDSMTVDYQPITSGDYIEIINDDVIKRTFYVGSDLLDMAKQLVDDLIAETSGVCLITIYKGNSAAFTGDTEQQLREYCEQYGDCDCDIQYGGQDVYPLIISVE